MLLTLLILLGLVVLSLLLTVVYLVKSLLSEKQTERDAHQKERTDLLNRLMTKEWTSYAQVSAVTTSPLSFDDEARGLSDDEELRRFEAASVDAVGEVLVDYSEDARLLGYGEE